jgi:hypothetical protein
VGREVDHREAVQPHDAVLAAALEPPQGAVGADAGVQDHEIGRRGLVERAPARRQALVGGQVVLPS